MGCTETRTRLRVRKPRRRATLGVCWGGVVRRVGRVVALGRRNIDAASGRVGLRVALAWRWRATLLVKPLWIESWRRWRRHSSAQIARRRNPGPLLWTFPFDAQEPFDLTEEPTLLLRRRLTTIGVSLLLLLLGRRLSAGRRRRHTAWSTT